MDWYELTDKEVLLELGTRFRLARTRHALTQQMLAEKAGLNRTTVRDLENGKSVHLGSWIAILRALQQMERLDDFLPGVNQSPVLAKMEKEKKRVRPSKSH
jgi:DNA-binding XRE family transcriptional regulator